MMLQAQNITKTYASGKKIALKDFSLSVAEGTVYGLLGPNGAGKTSFIRIINQITTPDSGLLYIQNEVLQPKHIKQIGYMPEERGLYKNMTIGDQILYFGALKGMQKSEAMREAKKWFDALHIEQWWNKKLSELSKGMAQKIQFVVTVLHQPKLLILDEPFSGFDPVNANLIKEEIIKLKNNGTTIILSTHRMESVEELCDAVALIHNAEKIIDGKVFDVREQYKKNVFSVVVSDVNLEAFSLFKNHFAVENEKLENGLLFFDLLPSSDANTSIKELMKIGKIRTFDEKIPSMNEVFIEIVSSIK